MTGKRDYGQFCGLAAALNVIGERWTLLIVRELLINPARFNEMIDNLPGIGPNLLSERLRVLIDHGVVRQRPVPGDGRGKWYEMTDLGQQLREPVLALARWGMQLLTEADTDGVVRAEWGFLAVQAMVVPEQIPPGNEVYEFKVGDLFFVVEVQDGVVTFARGTVERPTLTVTSDPDTFVRIGARLLTPLAAVATGNLKIEGDPGAIGRCIRMLGLE